MMRLSSLWLFVVFALVAASGLPPKRCPNVCKPRKLAKKECRSLFYGCSLQKCHYFVGKYKKKGRMCSDKVVLPPPHNCAEVCTTKKQARKACRRLYHKCIVKPCDIRPHYGPYPNEPQYKCTKIAPITPSPSPTPSLTPSPSPLCHVCPSDEFLTSDRCNCVNHPCDACPNGTVCREAKKKDLLLRQVETAVAGREVVPDTMYICVSCECGYCDASGDKCCGMYGANCVADAGALRGQCVYEKFDLLGNQRPGSPAGYNVCTPADGEVLGADIAEDMVNTCGCIPNNKKPCVVKRNYGYTNCRIPRL